jgi:iron complex outermembrane receptor protein
MEPDVKFSLNVLPLSIVLAASSVQVFAEDQLPALVVSASRSDKVHVPHASSIKVITREEIELSGARSLPELLRGQSGVYVSDLFGDGSNASVDMRGFGSTANANTLIMVDGRKLNFATDSGTLYFNAIDLDNVEQVEITQGSSGILFGNMAVGGVINVITRKPVEDVIEAALDVGSYNSHKERVRFENILDDGWSSRLVLVNRESDNYRDHNDAETKSASLRLDKVFNGGRVFAEYEYLDDYLETPGALFLDEIAQDRQQAALTYANDYQDLKNSVFRIGFEKDLSDTHHFYMDMAYQDDDRRTLSSFRTLGSVNAVQNRETITLNPRLNATYKNFKFTTGLDFEFTDYLLVSDFGPQGDDQAIKAAYINSSFEIHENWQLLAGVRYAEVENDISDYSGSYDLDDEITIGSVGLEYRPDKQLRVYLKVDENYRFARVDEHTNVAYLQPVGLNNQKGITYEIGTEYSSGGFVSSFSLYRLKLEDEISFDSSGYTNINLDETERNGVSISLLYGLTDNLILSGTYDYTDSQISSGPFDGNVLPLVPENRVSLIADYSIEDATFRIEGVYVDEQYFGSDFSNGFEKMNAYTVFNLSANYQFDKMSLNVRLNNLLNEHYSETGAIGSDTALHPGGEYSYSYMGTAYYNNPAQFTAPERSLWIGVKVNL